MEGFGRFQFLYYSVVYFRNKQFKLLKGVGRDKKVRPSFTLVWEGVTLCKVRLDLEMFWRSLHGGSDVSNGRGWHYKIHAGRQITPDNSIFCNEVILFIFTVYRCIQYLIYYHNINLHHRNRLLF